MHIREFDEHKDLNRLRECVIELQDFERRLDLRRPAGADIVGAYIPQMRERCEKCHGRILVAEADGEIAGYVMILTKVRSEDLEDGDVEYGLVADLVILEKFRKIAKVAHPDSIPSEDLPDVTYTLQEVRDAKDFLIKHVKDSKND